jgi:hypothetical protein
MQLFDSSEYDLKGRLSKFFRSPRSVDSFDHDFDELDSVLDDIDFSNFDNQDFKQSFAKVKSQIKKVVVPKGRKLIIEGQSKQSALPVNQQPIKAQRNLKQITNQQQNASRDLSGIPVNDSETALIKGRNKKLISKVMIPKERSIIVEGASKLMLSEDKRDDVVKKLGYFNGKKLQELIIEIDNDGEIDFPIALFDPSMPLDYLYNTSQNLNNRISVGGGSLQYSDVMFNILANPPIIHSAYFTIEGTNAQILKQEVLAMQFINKNIQGYRKIDPVNLSLKIDTMQVFNNSIAFDFHESLNRPFIPDGMDVINYTIYAGVKATLVFFYEQIHIKDVYYDEARKSKVLL